MNSPADRPALDLDAVALVSAVCGRISHDLNNVLAAIDGYAEFVEQDSSDRDQVLADVAQIRSAARNGSVFSRRLRRVGQLLDRTPERVDVSAVVREAAEQLEGAAGTAVQVDMTLADGLPPVRVDPGHLELALLSLVENAAEALPGGGNISLRTFAAGEAVALELTDPGPGIPAEILQRACEPFTSTKPRALGSGLGLFVVDGVARLAGGRLEIRSEAGHGTTVTLLFPSALDGDQ